MARTPEVVELIANVTEWPKSDVAMRVRYLTPDGWLPKGGRGLNSPDLTERHMAALVIAVLAGGPQAEAAKTVRTIGERAAPTLVSAPGPSRPLSTTSPNRKPLFASGTTFIDALAQAIAWRRDKNPLGDSVVGVGVHTEAGESVGYLTLSGPLADQPGAASIGLEFFGPEPDKSSTFGPSYSLSNRAVRISHATAHLLAALAEAA